MTDKERIAQLEAERDALAAALVKARDLAGTASCYEVDAALSTEVGSDVFGSPGIARKSLVKRAKNAWAEFDAIIDGDPTAILAARDKEKDEKIAALAAALEPFVRFAKQVSSSPNWVPDGCPVNVDPGGISDLAVGAFRRAEQALADHAAILAARDDRMKREGIVKLLDEFLMVCEMPPVEEGECAAHALRRLIKWKVDVALHPAVSERARDLRREGALEALRTWRARFGYHAPGENTILDEMDAAIAALDAEEADHA